MKMSTVEFAGHFANGFTKEIKDFATESILKEGYDCLIVTDREDKEKAFCTHCKKWVKIPGNNLHTGSPRYLREEEKRNAYDCHAGYGGMPEEEIERRKKIQDHKIKECPSCGHAYNVYHQWRMDMGWLDGTVSISVWAKSKVDPAAVVMRRIEISRHFGGSAEDVVKDTFVEAERYLFRMGHKTIRQKSEADWSNKRQRMIRRKRFVKRIADRAQCSSNTMWTDYVGGHYRMDVHSLLEAVTGTPYQYLLYNGGSYVNHYDRYAFRDSYPLYIVNYMDLYSLHPWVELLIKNGMDNMVMDHIRKRGCANAICWGAKTIKSAVRRFTKQDLKDILDYNSRETCSRDHVSETDLAFLAEAREKMFPRMDLISAVRLSREGFGILNRLYDWSKRLGLKPEKVLAYCLQGKAGRYSHAMGDWLDYISDAACIGLNLEDKANVMPQDIKKAHAKVLKRIKYREKRELDEQFKRSMLLRKRLFCWKGTDYFIRPAESAEELAAEGMALHHCVGGYADKYIRGETNILFVRSNSQPDKPLYTLETYKVRGAYIVAQLRGNMNADPPAEIRKMVESFIDRVNSSTLLDIGKKERILIA